MQVGEAAMAKGLSNGSLAVEQEDRYRASWLAKANGR
jgi:hypothetical protein